MFPRIGAPQNGWFIMENLIKMDDLGGPTPIFGNTHILQPLHPAMPAGDAWNLRWGETSRFAVGSTRRFRSLARPIDPEKTSTRDPSTRKGWWWKIGVLNRFLFDWTSDLWYVFIWFFTYEAYMKIFWKLLGSWSGTFLHAYFFLCLFALFDDSTCISSYDILCKRQVGLIIDAISCLCLCPCQLCFSSVLTSDRNLNTKPHVPHVPVMSWNSFHSILETDSMNCVELHHFVIKQNM